MISASQNRGAIRQFLLSAEFLGFLFGVIAIIAVQMTFLSGFELPAKQPPQPVPKNIERFSFGLREHTADVFWLRAIQEFPPCDAPDPRACAPKTWLGQMFLKITDLAPHFRMVYAVGGLTLSVLLDDSPGATALYERGVENFPNDWPILSRAGYHAMAEEHDPVKAAKLLRAAAEHGGPQWYFMLATRLTAETGDTSLGNQIITELEANPEKNAELIRKLRERMQQSKPASTH